MTVGIKITRIWDRYVPKQEDGADTIGIRDVIAVDDTLDIRR
jgi:hypothetical protein